MIHLKKKVNLIMKKNKKRTRKAFLFIKAFIRLIDKKIITPITKFILLISEKLGKRTDRFERWLVKKNTLLFISLVLAIALFIMIDNKQSQLSNLYLLQVVSCLLFHGFYHPRKQSRHQQLLPFLHYE